MLDEAANSCEDKAPGLLSHHSWADGEIGIGLACDSGNESGEKVCFDVWKTKILTEAAAICEKTALQLLRSPLLGKRRERDWLCLQIWQPTGRQSVV